MSMGDESAGSLTSRHRVVWDRDVSGSRGRGVYIEGWRITLRLVSVTRGVAEVVGREGGRLRVYNTGQDSFSSSYGGEGGV
jgi:hypothetical protein